MRIFQVDSFSNKIFSGNPAAVCLFLTDEDDSWMQNMASEMNLSETAFLRRANGGYDLRWFTPTTEVDLCGHGTLAAAHVLWEIGELNTNQVTTFFTKSGVLKARKLEGWIELDFPLEEAHEINPPQELLEGLQVEPIYAGKNRMDYIIEVKSEAEVRELIPNLEILSRLTNYGVIVTARSENDEFDFISRFFAPALGINEDPVTGSAHTCLGPYWRKKLNKTELKAYQASKRGGILKLEVLDRIFISGQATTVFRGKIN